MITFDIITVPWEGSKEISDWSTAVVKTNGIEDDSVFRVVLDITAGKPTTASVERYGQPTKMYCVFDDHDLTINLAEPVDQAEAKKDYEEYNSSAK